MAKRKRRPGRSRVELFSSFPVLALALWLGILAAAVLSLEKAPQRLAGQEESSEVPSTETPPANERQVAASRTPQPEPASAEQAESPKPTPKPTADQLASDPERRPSGSGSRTVRMAVTESSSESRPPSKAVDPDSTVAAEPQSEIAMLEAPDEAIPSPHIAQAQFTTGIVSREPIDRVTGVFHSRGQPVRTLYYYTDVRDLTGETVTHRWKYEGKVIATVTLEIGGPRWRTWSSNDLVSSRTGRWEVVVTDSEGHVLVTDSFVYRE